MTQTLEQGLPDLESLTEAPAAASEAPTPAEGRRLPDSVLKIPVSIQVMIGSTRIPLSQVAQLGPGTVIPLDQKLGEPALISVNGKDVARGELFVLDGEDNRLGITITETVTTRMPDF
jgi:flagellar motor switch protein FliN